MQRILEALRVSYTLPELEEMARDEERPVKAFEDAKALLGEAGNLESYRHLTIEEGREIALAALERYDAMPTLDDFLPQQVLTNLVKAVPGSLKELTSLFLERRLAYSEEQLFREADAATRDRIMVLLERGTSAFYTQEELLNALAWIGDELVQAHFHQWRTALPPWRTAKGFPLDCYPPNAGWELTSEGVRRDLYYQANYDLVPTPTAQTDTGPVGILKPHEGTCGWCRLPLLTLIDLDLTDSRMQFLEMPGTRLRLALCANCTLQAQPVFTEVDGEGKSVWSPLNGEPWEYLCFPGEESLEEILEDFPPHVLVLGQARKTPFIDHGSHLGGCPGWVQHAAYPLCPQCQRRMRFVGQYLYEVEALIYAFLCVSCGLAATHYQQT